MAEKRVNVRLAATGGRQVKSELRDVGEAGQKGFRRLSREVELANKRLALIARRAKQVGLTIIAAKMAQAATGIIRSGLQIIDQQAKLARSLDTTTASVQVLARAAELSGNTFTELEAGASRLTRRLSLFAADGSGPAADAIQRLGLNAAELLALPLDARIARVTEAIRANAAASEQAALFSQLFGDRAFVAFQRLDPGQLRTANDELRRFGVLVSDQDADRIEATNDAISRLGLLWRGLSNQLAIAAAPALQSAARALARLGEVGGPIQKVFTGLSTALVLLIDNFGRVASTAAAFAGFFAGRFVARLALAAVGVRGLATALVVLRGALIRTGLGALIVGAGELIFQFTRLVQGAGGVGNALELLGTVARAVWVGIRATVGAFIDDFRAMRADIESIWLRLMAFLSRKWADFLGRIGPTFNAVSDRIGADTRIDWFGAQSYASMLDHAASNAGNRAEALRGRAAGTRAGAFEGVREAVDALMAAMRRSGADGEGALDDAAAAADRVRDALEDAGAAGRAAGSDTADGAEDAVTGWAAVTAALSDYATKAREIGGDIGQSLVGAFRSAEDAVGEFVKTGKLQVSDLVSSVIADLARLAARKFILGPIAGALSGALGGAGNIFAGILHAGGMVGAAGPARMVPAMAFAGAPRMHSGGAVGLKPDEVPAILQRGERVLSRREARVHDGPRRDREAAPIVNISIQTRDAESFRQSRTQVAADIARAVSMGRRGL